MRLGILLMLATGLALLYQRHRLSPEQQAFQRYVEVDLRMLQQVEAPVIDRLGLLLSDRHQSADVVRRRLVEELIPDLLRLRRLAEAPLGAATTAAVRELAQAYIAVVDLYIDAARTAVWAIDDPALQGREGLLRIGTALRAALERHEQWRKRLRELARQLRFAAHAQS